MLTRTKLDQTIEEYVVGSNAVRNREILKRRLIDGETYEKLSEDFHLSTRHVKSIVRKYRNTILQECE